MACALALQCAAGAGDTPYKLLNEIPIGGEGGWDILTVDSPTHRLYLSHSSKVVVVDLAKGTVVGEITDTPGVHGFVAIPELGRAFAVHAGDRAPPRQRVVRPLRRVRLFADPAGLRSNRAIRISPPRAS